MGVDGTHYRTYIIFVPVYQDKVNDVVRFGPLPRRDLFGSFNEDSALASVKPVSPNSVSRIFSGSNPVDTDNESDWSSKLIEAAAQDVYLTGSFDGLLMFAAADVYAFEEALENIFPYLREKARVAAFGAKLSTKGFGCILNPFLRMLFNLSFSTTPRPDYEPWRILAKRVEKLDVQEYFFGLMFLCSGSVVRKKQMNDV